MYALLGLQSSHIQHGLQTFPCLQKFQFIYSAEAKIARDTVNCLFQFFSVMFISMFNVHDGTVPVRGYVTITRSIIIASSKYSLEIPRFPLVFGPRHRFEAST
jgi:hypothetical protein